MHSKEQNRARSLAWENRNGTGPAGELKTEHYWARATGAVSRLSAIGALR
jgi:hypothetical protein